jgi:hypothetical protein
MNLTRLGVCSQLSPLLLCTYLLRISFMTSSWRTSSTPSGTRARWYLNNCVCNWIFNSRGEKKFMNWITRISLIPKSHLEMFPLEESIRDGNVLTVKLWELWGGDHWTCCISGQGGANDAVNCNGYQGGRPCMLGRFHVSCSVTGSSMFAICRQFLGRLTKRYVCRRYLQLIHPKTPSSVRHHQTVTYIATSSLPNQ